MQIRKAVFPVAGMGTRLLPATKAQPKEMLPVGYKPVVQYVVEEMIAQSLDRFLFITGRKKRSIEDHFDDDPELAAHLVDKSIGEVDYEAEGVEFYYARQRRPLGSSVGSANPALELLSSPLSSPPLPSRCRDKHIM